MRLRSKKRKLAYEDSLMKDLCEDADDKFKEAKEIKKVLYEHFEECNEDPVESSSKLERKRLHWGSFLSPLSR